MLVLNPQWQKNMLDKLQAGSELDITLKSAKPATWLIAELLKRNRLFKVYKVSGVTRITTETDSCPCCKRKL
jgi:hypothetical protein